MTLRHCMVIIIASFIVTGCATTQKGPSTLVRERMTLEEWTELKAVPYLLEKLGKDPMFKGETFLLVDMTREDINTEIDALTLQLRERFIDAFLTKPGIGLVWRPSKEALAHHRSLTRVQCARLRKERFYIGIDAFLSPVDETLTISIRALDLEERRWVTGFGISYRGSATPGQKKSLLLNEPDDYLLGLRPLPFNNRQADLLAAYLGRNLSCLFTTMERGDAVVYVDKKPIRRISYFQNALGLVKNYLAKYRRVTVTDDPGQADILVEPTIHPIHPGLYQVWVTAKYKKGGRYLPGTETEAYVFLGDHKGSAPGPIRHIYGSDRSDPLSEASFDLCFIDFKPSFRNRVFPILKQYPGITGIKPLYEACTPNAPCLCYLLTTDAKNHKAMDNLMIWLDTKLSRTRNLTYTMVPETESTLKIFFKPGFD